MIDLLYGFFTWLHTLATVVFIGHYVLLAVVYLPALSNKEGSGITLSEISRRSRVWLYASLLVFIITGTYLMLVDPGYLGLMNFGNAWGVLMLCKHVLVLAMIVFGFWSNAILRLGPLMSSNSGAAQAIDRFQSHVNTMAILGVLVLLLTSLAQAG